MRMKQRSRDWLNLSAYLDGEMSAREKLLLEQRLQKDQNMQNELHQLKFTRSLIHSLPHRKVPRDFMLSPDMVKVGKKNLLVPIFSYSSLASVFVAIVLLLVQFLPNVLFMRSAVASEELAMESARSMVSPEIIYWGDQSYSAEVYGKGGGEADSNIPYSAPMLTYGIEGDIEAPAEESAPAADALTQSMPEGGLMQPQATTAVGLGATTKESGEANAADNATEEEPVTEEAQVLRDESQQSNPVLGIRPEAANEMTYESTSAAQVESSNREPVLYITICLLVLAVVTGGTAIFLKRRV